MPPLPGLRCAAKHARQSDERFFAKESGAQGTRFDFVKRRKLLIAMTFAARVAVQKAKASGLTCERRRRDLSYKLRRG